MIHQLTLRDVGPTRSLTFDLAERLNVITGNNGLGKTFVLDALWWMVTGAWARQPAFPWRPREMLSGVDELDGSQDQSGVLDPRIAAELIGRFDGAAVTVTGRYQPEKQNWIRTLDGDASPPSSVIIYARADGRFAVWDALYANGSLDGMTDSAFSWSEAEVWNGKIVRQTDIKTGERERTVIRGLIEDWVTWQRASTPEFTTLRKVLAALGTDEDPLVPGQPTRVHLDDRRDIPTLDTPYGMVPVTLASAGIRRALALAYLLVWTWTEHRKAAKLLQAKPTRDIILLVDEPELHLHPAWQRVFLPSVMRAVSLTAPNAAVQIVAATHSPLVMASLETVFQEDLDDSYILEASGSLIRAVEQPFCKMGDVVYWLNSPAFGGVGGRSVAASLAIQAAQDFMAERAPEAERALVALRAQIDALGGLAQFLSPNPDAPLEERIHQALAQTLPGHDEFWVHWSLVYHPIHGLRSKR